MRPLCTLLHGGNDGSARATVHAHPVDRLEVFEFIAVPALLARNFSSRSGVRFRLITKNEKSMACLRGPRLQASQIYGHRRPAANWGSLQQSCADWNVVV